MERMEHILCEKQNEKWSVLRSCEPLISLVPETPLHLFLRFFRIWLVPFFLIQGAVSFCCSKPIDPGSWYQIALRSLSPWEMSCFW